jgi:hypothetical protein
VPEGSEALQESVIALATLMDVNLECDSAGGSEQSAEVDTENDSHGSGEAGGGRKSSGGRTDLACAFSASGVASTTVASDNSSRAFVGMRAHSSSGYTAGVDGAESTTPPGWEERIEEEGEREGISSRSSDSSSPSRLGSVWKSTVLGGSRQGRGGGRQRRRRRTRRRQDMEAEAREGRAEGGKP